MFNHIDHGMAPMPKTKDDNYFLDVDPIYFQHILNYLRHGELITKSPEILRGIKHLANFFGLTDLLNEIEDQLYPQWVTLRFQGKREYQIDRKSLIRYEQKKTCTFV